MNDKKDKVVRVRLTDSLYAKLCLEAEATGLTNSEYIRQLISQNKVTPNNKNYAKIISEINRIGNNLNQLTKTINQLKKANLLDNRILEHTQLELAIINDKLKKILNKCK